MISEKRVLNKSIHRLKNAKSSIDRLNAMRNFYAQKLELGDKDEVVEAYTKGVFDGINFVCSLKEGEQ